MSIIKDFIDGHFLPIKTKEIGIGGFTALVRTRERYIRTSSVPTTYLEDGSHINDHIIRDPLFLLIEGNVSDVHIRPSKVIEAIKRTQGYIGIITQYIPERTEAQANKVEEITNNFISAVNQIDAAIEAGEQLSGFIGLIDSASKSNVEAFIGDMESYYQSDQLMEIDTISGLHKDMRITHLEIERDNEFNAISFRIEAQQLRFADSIFTQIALAPSPSKGTDGATENLEDKGVQKGGDMPTSSLAYLLQTFGF